MVEHIGFDAQATNAHGGAGLVNPPLKSCPPIPTEWPAPIENPQCPALARRFYDLRPAKPEPPRWPARLKQGLKKAVAVAVDDPAVQNMDRKEFAKLFVPPVAVGLFRRIRSRVKGGGATLQPVQENIEWEYIPEGWAYAGTHPEVKGWNVQDVLEIYKQKWPRFVATVQGTGPLGVAHESDLASREDIASHNTMMAFAYALALAAHRKDTLSLLDWGGGIGHYCLLAQALLPDVHIEYHCKDAPLLAEYGAQLFPKQYFYADERCFERTYDLVVASTSLHYSEDWLALLGRLADVTTSYLYIANLPTVQQASSFVFIQRPYQYGYNRTFPLT
jgi:putative methyltransferase (TIGR04325 family)